MGVEWEVRHASLQSPHPDEKSPNRGDAPTDARTIRVLVSMSEEELLSTRIVLAVAKEKDADPLELPPLGEQLDPDALDTLFRDRLPDDAELSFEYAGVRVVVREGRVSVHSARG